MKKPSLYSEDLYLIEDEDYFTEQNGKIFEKVLVGNKAVGMMGGYYEEGLPITFVSKFMLAILEYTYEEFLEVTSAKFSNIICSKVRDNFTVEKFEEISETKELKIHTGSGKKIQH